MLPPLDTRGFLPPGVHTATIQEVKASFASNAARKHLLDEFRRFIRERLVHVATGLELVACGSFFSDKIVPEDIDCTVLVPGVEVPRRIGLFTLLSDGRSQTAKGSIWDEYRVHIYPSIEMPGLSDFVAFFQYVGVKSAALKNLKPTDKRGVVRIEQWTLG